ncbi:hypothetical protein HNR60_000317 [Rhodopseudomonas rhenobacensis]|uniref:DUF2380 domain-containing protein n=1 Tax=Rhodopseudomonas rhenobacensis TaxID=87461 RepID=A0A7W8DX74_9BRAD|nr:DUF3280 domain-containing protein [Rhodopseudomonas rhenobacensis]MBB5045588.1 hypothetical protein [Rhodopseudomonas rhenobacensis]
MRNAGWLIALLLLGAPAQAEDAPKVAVFDFELLDTSLQGEIEGARADEQARLMRSGDQLRKGLAASGKYQVLDIAPINSAAHAKNLQACGGCDVQLAQQLGADIAITGQVQKVSNLILNMNVYLRNTRTGHLVTAMSADFRGNTDDSWARAVNFLLRNRLLAPDYGRPQPQ